LSFNVTINYFRLTQFEFEALSIEVNIGTTPHYFGSSVFIMIDGFCSTSMKYCDSHPVVLLRYVTINFFKIRIFNACVKSVLWYGCETWLVTSEIRRKIQTSVNRCLRYILRIWWPKLAIVVLSKS
jgi:hypothetical protein